MNDLVDISSNSVSGQVKQQGALASVQISIAMAKKFPRNRKVILDNVMDECMHMSLAEKAEYVYPQGNTEVSGPSIHLALAIAREWGNIEYGIRHLSSKDGESEIEAFVWDLETGAKKEMVFRVPHKVYSKKHGNRTIESTRDIYQLVANYGHRELRGLLLNMFPSHIVDEAMKQCRKTMADEFQVNDESILSLLNAFVDISVDKSMIEKRIGKRIEAITPAQFADMRKIYNSIKDGMSTADDWFEKPKIQEKSMIHDVLDKN